MRKDIAKLITERPRYGHHAEHNLSTRKKVRYVPDPEHEYEDEVSVRLPKRKTKEFSDNLSFIHNLLKKQVGKTWDEIHAEFCSIFGKNSLERYHALEQHIKSYIEFNTAMGVGGVEVFYPYGADYRPLADNPYTRHGEVFYIHPVSGVLCLYKRTKKKDNGVVFSELFFTRTSKGGYTIELWKVRRTGLVRKVLDKLPTEHTSLSWARYFIENNNWFIQYGDRPFEDVEGISHISKKQLNKKEIKQINDWLLCNFEKYKIEKSVIW